MRACNNEFVRPVNSARPDISHDLSRIRTYIYIYISVCMCMRVCIVFSRYIPKRFSNDANQYSNYKILSFPARERK